MHAPLIFPAPKGSPLDVAISRRLPFCFSLPIDFMKYYNNTVTVIFKTIFFLTMNDLNLIKK